MFGQQNKKLCKDGIVVEAYATRKNISQAVIDDEEDPFDDFFDWHDLSLQVHCVYNCLSQLFSPMRRYKFESEYDQMYVSVELTDI